MWSASCSCGLPSARQCQYVPLPKCVLAIFQRESPFCTEILSGRALSRVASCVLAVCGTNKVAPRRMSPGSTSSGLAASHSGQRAPLPKCWREIFQSESPERTVTMARESIRAVGLGAERVGATAGAILVFGTTDIGPKSTALLGGAAATAGGWTGATGATGLTRAGEGVAEIAARDCGEDSGTRKGRAKGSRFAGAMMTIGGRADLSGGAAAEPNGARSGAGAARDGRDKFMGKPERGGTFSACSAWRAAFSRRKRRATSPRDSAGATLEFVASSVYAGWSEGGTAAGRFFLRASMRARCSGVRILGRFKSSLV